MTAGTSSDAGLFVFGRPLDNCNNVVHVLGAGDDSHIGLALGKQVPSRAFLLPLLVVGCHDFDELSEFSVHLISIFFY